MNFYHFRTAILVGHMTSSKLSICYDLVRSQEELRKMNTVIIAKVLFQIARFILYLDSFYVISTILGARVIMVK